MSLPIVFIFEELKNVFNKIESDGKITDETYIK